jgi:hypothetical protein
MRRPAAGKSRSSSRCPASVASSTVPSSQYSMNMGEDPPAAGPSPVGAQTLEVDCRQCEGLEAARVAGAHVRGWPSGVGVLIRCKLSPTRTHAWPRCGVHMTVALPHPPVTTSFRGYIWLVLGATLRQLGKLPSVSVDRFQVSAAAVCLTQQTRVGGLPPPKNQWLQQMWRLAIGLSLPLWEGHRGGRHVFVSGVVFSVQQ